MIENYFKEQLEGGAKDQFFYFIYGTEMNGGFHSDILRVVKTSSYSDREEWALNDVGGQDIWFWAFDVEQDAVLFSLKWSS